MQEEADERFGELEYESWIREIDIKEKRRQED